MTFIDVLRDARVSRAAVLHEFWTQYDPSRKRVHAFFEGHDDAVFFRPFLQQYVSPDLKIITYHCNGKRLVYEAFTQITGRIPSVRHTLFFVDKDLDDVLGIPWPTDPRIFVTDVYSIENYIVSHAVLEKFYRDSVRLREIAFDENVIMGQFEGQLAKFQRRMLVVMAWILVMRRAGAKPNLNDMVMSELCEISDACEIKARRGQRLASLVRTTGVHDTGNVLRRVLHVARELSRIPAKRVIRGKLEAWYFVEFWKRLVRQVRQLSEEVGGRAASQVGLERGTFVAILSSYVEIPQSLALFLEAHFRSNLDYVDTVLPDQRGSSVNWWSKLAFWRKTRS